MVLGFLDVAALLAQLLCHNMIVLFIRLNSVIFAKGSLTCWKFKLHCFKAAAAAGESFDRLES